MLVALHAFSELAYIWHKTKNNANECDLQCLGVAKLAKIFFYHMAVHNAKNKSAKGYEHNCNLV